MVALTQTITSFSTRRDHIHGFKTAPYAGFLDMNSTSIQTRRTTLSPQTEAWEDVLRQSLKPPDQQLIP